VSEQGFAVLGKTAGDERQGSGEFVQCIEVFFGQLDLQN
jgi:hypothetical protein